MESFRVANSVSFGSMLAAFDGITEAIVATTPPSPISTAAADLTQRSSPRSLYASCVEAVAQGADVLFVVGPKDRATLHDPLPLPVVSLTARTTLDDVRKRMLAVSQMQYPKARPSEEHARARIVDIVDRVAAALDGHVIVEDESFRMVAYSQLANPVDDARQSAILQRRLPPTMQAVFNAQGVLADLLSGEDLVETQPAPEVGLGARLVVAIRHNGRLVGTIWLAREGLPFSERDTSELFVASRQMSGILADALRERHDAQLRRDDAGLDLLSGRNLDAAKRVLWDAAPRSMRGAHVLTVDRIPRIDAPRGARLTDFRALAEAIVSSARSEAVIVPNGERLCIAHFGCGEPSSSCSAEGARHVAAQISDGLRRVNIPVAVGIGKHVDDADQIVHSARSAEQVLSALLRLRRPAVSTAQDAWAFLLVSAYLDAPRAQTDTVPPRLLELLASDSPRDRELLLTVRTALNHWGDVAEISKHLHVHQNTVRYRLQRFSEVCEINLEVPMNRLALWMSLTRNACFDDEDSAVALSDLLSGSGIDGAPLGRAE